MTKEKLEKMLKKGSGLIVLVVIFFLAAALFLGLGLMTMNDVKNTKTKEYSYSADEGDYCSFEVCLITNYAVKEENGKMRLYYAQNPDGDCVALWMNVDTYKTEFKEVTKWYGYEEDWDKTVTVEGSVVKMEPDLSMYATEYVRDFDDPALNSMRNRNVYINCGVNSDKQDAIAILIFAGVFAVLGVLSIIGVANKKKRAGKTIAGLDDAALDDVLADYNDPNTVKLNKKGTVALGSKYIFMLNNGTIIPYEDALWIYTVVNRTNGIATGQSLNLRTADKKTYMLTSQAVTNKGSAKIEEYMNIIAQHNPNILVGFDSINNSQYKEMVKQRSAK
ncbi:MAG: hypothetical protein J6L81_01325 [Clostridia bacterium]|nr:hypothetical protein [Clostridia bacterium]